MAVMFVKCVLLTHGSPQADNVTFDRDVSQLIQEIEAEADALLERRLSASNESRTWSGRFGARRLFEDDDNDNDDNENVEEEPTEESTDQADGGAVNASLETANTSDLGWMSVLQKASASSVRLTPYPHLVIYDALPSALYNKLAAGFPSIKTIMSANGNKKMANNFRYDISASKARGRLNALWTKFVNYHTSNEFYKEVVRVFGPGIRKQRPDVEKLRKRKLEALSVHTRYKKKSNSELAIDCQVGMNSPVRVRSRHGVRGPHVDAKKEVWGALLYFRQPKDTSTGGALQVFKCKGKCRMVPEREKRKRGMLRGYHQQFDHADLNLVATVPYKRNTLVWFINSDSSVHSVTSRSVTHFSRRLVNFWGGYD